MGLISSNELGVYIFKGPLDVDPYTAVSAYDPTQPMTIVQYQSGTSNNGGTVPGDAVTTSPTMGVDYVVLFEGQQSGPCLEATSTDEGTIFNIIYIVEWKGNGLVDVLSYYSPSTGAGTFDMELVALATSSTIEVNNSVNTTAARTGDGTSTTITSASATAWGVSVDGLLDVSGNGGSAIDIMDLARNQYYTLLRFDVGPDDDFIGQATIDSASISGGVDDIATYSASFTGTGELYDA